MAKKKIDPQVQRMMESFNRTPTAAEEADFYRRNAGGPMVMTSMTRGRGAFGYVGHHDRHIMSYWSHLCRLDPSLRYPPLTQEDWRINCEIQNALDRAWRLKVQKVRSSS
jgi:hypothetical protein